MLPPCLSRCLLNLAFWLLVGLLALALAAGAQILDAKVAPDEQQLSVFDVTEMLATRVHNQTALPPSCSQIITDDAVADKTIGSQCLPWCYETLGSGSGVAYAISPVHVMSIWNSPQKDIYLSCWKAETADFAFWMMPSSWLLYVYSLCYSGISLAVFWRKWRQTPRQENLNGPSNTQITPTGPFQDGYAHFPFCGKKVSSDREGCELKLWFTACCTWSEPLLDLLSILTVLRKGHLYLTATMAFGFLLPCFFCCCKDTLADETARSLAQGYETRGLFRQQGMNVLESLWCTAVQVYVLMTATLSTLDLVSLINLALAACLGILVSIPRSAKAFYVMRKLDSESENAYTFAKIEDTKASFPLGERLVAMAIAPSLGVLVILMKPSGLNIQSCTDEQERNSSSLEALNCSLWRWVEVIWQPLTTLWWAWPGSFEAWCRVILLSSFRVGCLIPVAVLICSCLVGTLFLCGQILRFLLGHEAAYQEMGPEDLDGEASGDEANCTCRWA